ncbi:hypothetical protein PVIIG_06416 [Plasmodium vivax India VII]|uniref:VIR protein n=1 Tax=Plasmodium vivax India VII TaxID=1077284 RepID=A0A0J9S4E1_PLAVI|nr:hypothetical protein PVIIG_06416 [Plasmodium vivax India VII]
MIKNEYTITEYNNKKEPWCSKYPYDLKTRYPDKLTPLKCEESISKESIIAHSLPQPDKTDCDCSQNVIPVTLALPDEPLEKDRTKNLAVTSGFTAFGTLGTLLVLYKFTPMASWFRRTGINNVGTDLYMDPGAPDGFLSMQNGNGSNNIFYQP